MLIIDSGRVKNEIQLFNAYPCDMFGARTKLQNQNLVSMSYRKVKNYRKIHTK